MNNKFNNGSSELSINVISESNEPKSLFDSRKTSVINSNDDSNKTNKQKKHSNNHLSFKKKNSEETYFRQSTFNINENQDNIKIKHVFSNSSGQVNDEDKNVVELKKNNKDLESESNDGTKVHSEKINFTDMIKNKILKINIIPLCSDFINYLDVDKFSEFIDAFMKIKIFKFSLENIKIPPFRNLTKNSFDHAEFSKKNTIISNINPIIKRKKRFVFVIVLLILIGILIMILMIFFLK